MEAVKERLGKVGITVEKDYWSIDRAYDRLVIVELKGALRTFISRKPVPPTVSIFDREYWLPFSSLQEQFVNDHNAWANKYSARVEALENTLKEVREQLQQQGINYAPIQNNLITMLERLKIAEFHNRINSFINMTTAAVVFTIKTVNCYMDRPFQCPCLYDSDYDENYPASEGSILPTMFSVSLEDKIMFKTDTIKDGNTIRDYVIISYVQGNNAVDLLENELSLEGTLHFHADPGYSLNEDTVNYYGYFGHVIAGDELVIETNDGMLTVEYNIVDNSSLYVQAFKDEQ